MLGGWEIGDRDVGEVRALGEVGGSRSSRGVRGRKIEL